MPRKSNKNQPKLFLPTPEAEPQDGLTTEEITEVFGEEEPLVQTSPPGMAVPIEKPEMVGPGSTVVNINVPALNMGDVSDHWKIMVHKRDKAVLALTSLLANPIMSDEDDEKLAKELVLARNTIEQVEEQRKEITKILDAAKKEFMVPEKDIKSLYEQGRTNRDRWANEKLRRQQEENARIEKQKNHDQELIKVRAALDTAVVDGIINAINQMNVQIEEHVKSMTPQNWDVKAKRFDMEPKLNPDRYHAMFMVDWNPMHISQEEYNKLVADAKERWTYDDRNRAYIESARGVIKMWKDDLPRIREQKILGNEQIQNAEAHKRAEAATAHLETEKSKIQTDTRNELLNSEFKAQVAQQENHKELRNVKQVRTASIEAETAGEQFETILLLVENVMSSDKFSGIRKENGEYLDWIEWLLKFAAAHLDEVPGVKFNVELKTIQKA